MYVWSSLYVPCWKGRHTCYSAPVLIQGGFVTDEETLEADGRQQAQDQEAFLNAVDSKPHSSSSAFNNDIRGKLEAIWSKRLTITSQLSEPDSLADCFWIDNPDSFEYIDHLSSGAFKTVDRRKWLGETVAVALSQGYPKQQLMREVGLLARVQHPNVVELLGCAFKQDDGKKSRSFLVTELMEQDLESLIRKKLRRNDGSETYREGPPFALAVAVDIALQIVEAVLHVRECKVTHRDLKLGNCLVSSKFGQDSLLGLVDEHVYYTVKLIDFGTSKLRGTEDTKAGTTSYMAPELSVKKPYTWSADVWSFGMTCYKIFTSGPSFLEGFRDVCRSSSKIVVLKIRRHDRPFRKHAKICGSSDCIVHGRPMQACELY